MDRITALHKRYADLVAEYGLSLPDREPNTPWAQQHAEKVVKGLTKDGIMHHVANIVGIGGLAGPWLRELTEEIELSIRPWFTPKGWEVFAGEFPTGCLNAHVYFAPEGYLILVDREIIQLFYDFVLVINALRLRFVPSGFSIVPEKDAFGEGFDEFVTAVAAIVLHHLHVATREQANSHINRLTDRARRSAAAPGVDSVDCLSFEFGYSAQVIKACLSFILAHEYAHILSGHLSPSRTARIWTTRGELTVAAKVIDQEWEADNVANRILTGILEHRLGHTAEIAFTQFVEGILVFAGPPLFFCLDAVIENVSSHLVPHATKTGERDHPPPEERLLQQNKLFQPFRAEQDLFLLADVYSVWLQPTINALPQAVTQILTEVAPEGRKLLSANVTLAAEEHHAFARDSVASRLGTQQDPSKLEDQARACERRNALRQAIVLYQASAAIREKNGHDEKLAATYHYLGQLFGRIGETDQANTYFTRSYERALQQGDKGGAATTFHAIAELAESGRDFSRAEGFYKRCLEIEKQLQNWENTTAVVHSLVRVARARRDFPAAECWLTTLLNINSQQSNEVGLADTFQRLGLLAEEQGDISKAIAHYSKALDISQRINYRHGEAMAHSGLGTVVALKHDKAACLHHYLSAYRLSVDLGDKDAAQTMLDNLRYLHQTDVISQEDLAAQWINEMGHDLPTQIADFVCVGLDASPLRPGSHAVLKRLLDSGLTIDEIINSLEKDSEFSLPPQAKERLRRDLEDMA